MLNTCTVTGVGGWSTPAMEQAARTLGYPSWRPGQAEALHHLIHGRDVLCIMPTGGGKSLCYQVAAVLLPGVTVVVSPLIALMEDQQAAALRRGVAAVAFTSHQGPAARAEAEARVQRGETRLVLAAPEGLRAGGLLHLLRRRGVSLLAVDEAHCISAWGHDFRPEYARLSDVRTALSPTAVLATTATATPRVQRDILTSLRMDHARVVLTGVDRPNLRLGAEALRGWAMRRARVVEVLRQHQGHGRAIVYAPTRAQAEQAADHLRQHGMAAAAYHAGLRPPERAEVQQGFTRGEVRVVCATNAFGMGVDQPDVRVVIHRGPPRSLAAYAQEVGRAGRDGEPAHGLLMWDAQDFTRLRQWVDAGSPDAALVAHALQQCRTHHAALRGTGMEVLVSWLRRQMGPAARACVSVLWELGLIRPLSAGVEVDVQEPLPERAAELVMDRREHALRDVTLMQDYAEGGCRRAALAAYFSATAAGDCGTCDQCRQRHPLAEQAPLTADAWVALCAVRDLRGRVGLQRVADALCGSRAAAVLRAGLQRIPGYGAMTGRRTEALRSLRLLREAGLVALSAGPLPTVRVTPAGWQALRRGPAAAPQPVIPAAPGSPGVSASTVDRAAAPGEVGPLHARLVHWRRERARERGVRPAQVLPDGALTALCVVRPRHQLELAIVPGMTGARVAEVGEDLLRLVREH